MKITVLRKGIMDKETVRVGLEMAQKHLATIGLDVKFSVFDTDKNFTSKSFSNDTNRNGYMINSPEIFQEAKEQGVPFSLACLIHDATLTSPQPTNPVRDGLSVQIPQQWYRVYPNVLAEFILHELSHFFCNYNGVTDRTHEYVYPFTQQQRENWYLHLIQKNYKEPQVIGSEEKELYKPKNFALKELVSPKIYKKYGEQAWQFLDERMLRNLQWVRDNLGPVLVNGGGNSYRGFDACEYRKKGTSQHNHGRAVDFTVKGMDSALVREWIISNQKDAPEPNMWLEEDVGWCHLDVRFSQYKGVHLFKP